MGTLAVMLLVRLLMGVGLVHDPEAAKSLVGPPFFVPAVLAAGLLGYFDAVHSLVREQSPAECRLGHWIWVIPAAWLAVEVLTRLASGVPIAPLFTVDSYGRDAVMVLFFYTTASYSSAAVLRHASSPHRSSS